jgi:calcineurin-like phosphoesterase family protein
MISDLHFGHKRIVEFGTEGGSKFRTGDNHVENMHHIIQNWNNTVTKRDLVYVLGDIAFNQEGFDALKELKGRKIMIRGNHDNYFTTQKWLEVFESVESLINYKGHWMSHAPIHPTELRGKKNIHGHVHQQSIRNSYTGEYDLRYINVCCEAVGETPFPFELIKNGDYHALRKC